MGMVGQETLAHESANAVLLKAADIRALNINKGIYLQQQ